MWYLAIVVLATIMLYYELYIAGAVAPSIIAGYGMTFPFYVYISVVGNAVGAFGSLAAGLGDRWGRANMTAYGLLLVAVLILFGIPNAHDKWTYAIIFGIIGLVEGVILVATPALVRDFSPQLGRASAMGFWTLGPVLGSLVVSVVSSNTLSHLHAWQDQFTICGIVGLVIAALAIFGLRELSPGLRDQLMVSLRDRALIEAKARGLDVAAALRNPWRQMMRLDVIGSAFAISVFLIIYYTAVGFFTIYFTALHGFSLSTANSIGNWFWAFDALGLIVIGIISDKIGVRKPFMVVGAVGAIIMTIVFLNLGAHTSYATFAVVISINAVFLAIAYAPWMASFTETVEKHNPALTATGLAVWGWIIRAVVALSLAFLPVVISSMTPIVTYGTPVQTLAAKDATQLATVSAIDPATLAGLNTAPPSTAAEVKAVGEIATTFKISPAAATARLEALAPVKADLVFLNEHAGDVQKAAAAAPGQWKNWWWVCVGGEVVFLPFILIMTGRWSPKKAREDAAEHERAVQQELAALQPQD
jgi:MFS family permease